MMKCISKVQRALLTVWIQDLRARNKALKEWFVSLDKELAAWIRVASSNAGTSDYADPVYKGLWITIYIKQFLRMTPITPFQAV
jgi:hypothetical protein